MLCAEGVTVILANIRAEMADQVTGLDFLAAFLSTQFERRLSLKDMEV